MIVVIPSSRGVNLQNVAPLIDYGCRFIVVDDTAGTIKVDHPRFEVYSWRDRRRLMGPNEIAIPKGNGACRDLGFYMAWKEGDPDEIVVALDDDCVVESADFVRRVEDLFGDGHRPVASGAGRHFNTFDLYEDPAIRSQFPRGFPYSARLGYRSWATGDETRGGILMNLGLWKGILDINAVDRITAQAEAYPEAALRFESVVVPQGALISVCSGNMQFRRSIIPAIYQLPMNVEVMPGWNINRYGDIWGGFIVKLLMDCRGDSLSVGQPLVRHMRVGPAVANVAQEHLAHLVNEEFIDLLDRASETIKPRDYLDMMSDLQDRLASLAQDTSPVLRAYLQALDRGLRAWNLALGACSH